MNWIKVEEKLPELTLGPDGIKDYPSEWVLISEGNEMYVAAYTIYDKWAVNSNEIFCDDELPIHPTHWMPLPKPPKE